LGLLPLGGALAPPPVLGPVPLLTLLAFPSAWGGWLKGGKAGAEKLSPEERREIAKRAAAAR